MCAGPGEDPNLALVVPVIDFCCRGTRFEGRANINPLAPADGCLSFFFFRSDPHGLLSRFLNSSGYVSAGNAVFCPLPFMESILKFSECTSGDVAKIPVYTVNDEEPAWPENAVPEKILEDVKKSINALVSQFFLEWLFAHEVGHAELGHALRLSTGEREPRECEREADNFFIGRISDGERAVKVHMALSDLLLGVFLRHYEEENGHRYEGPGFATERAQIHVREIGGPHPPFVVRLLNLAEALQQAYPEVEPGDYFARVRRNVIIVDS